MSDHVSTNHLNHLLKNVYKLKSFYVDGNINYAVTTALVKSLGFVPVVEMPNGVYWHKKDVELAAEIINRDFSSPPIVVVEKNDDENALEILREVRPDLMRKGIENILMAAGITQYKASGRIRNKKVMITKQQAELFRERLPKVPQKNFSNTLPVAPIRENIEHIDRKLGYLTDVLERICKEFNIELPPF